jgi:hypothetical protein
MPAGSRPRLATSYPRDVPIAAWQHFPHGCLRCEQGSPRRVLAVAHRLGAQPQSTCSGRLGTFRIRRREVDLVTDAVDSEFDGFVSDSFSVDVVNQRHRNFPGHDYSPPAAPLGSRRFWLRRFRARKRILKILKIPKAARVKRHREIRPGSLPSRAAWRRLGDLLARAPDHPDCVRCDKARVGGV